MEEQGKLINSKYNIYIEYNFKALLSIKLILILKIILVKALPNSRNKLLLYSEPNQILLKINEIGTFPIINSRYYFKPDSYYLNNDPNPKVFTGQNITFTESSNDIKLIFGNTVGNCSLMFKGCSKITEIDLSNFISPNKGNIDSMFQDCSSLKIIKFGNFETSKMTGMNYVFQRCSSLESLDLSKFNTSKVTHFHYMFGGCTSLKYLDLSNFDGSSVLCVNNMFNGCTSINSINLLNFDISKVTIIHNMFYNCKKLISLDLSSFALNTLTTPEYINNTFYGCKSFEYMNFKNFIISNTNLKIYENMVQNSENNIVFCFDEFKTISNQQIKQKNCSLKIYKCLNWRENNKKMISGSNICVDSCSYTSFLYEFSGKCYTECPFGTVEKNFKCYDCIEKGNCDEISVNDFKNQMREKITSYMNKSNIIKGSNFLAAVSSDKINPEDQIKNGISAFNLGNCTNVLKEYYKIPENENLIILNLEIKTEKNDSINVDVKSFNLGKNTQLEIYDNLGRKLNFSICTEDIKIFKYMGDAEQLDINTASSLSEKGIDVFNASDEFFNDLCHQYDNSDGKDIILNDRRNDIYQNASFCQNGCKYRGMNYNLMVANCICDSIFLQEEEENNITYINENIEETDFQTFTNVLMTNLFNFNFGVLKCYNLIFNTKILFHNLGFYSLIFMFILQIIFFIIYLVKKLTKIKNFIIKLNNKMNKSNNSEHNKRKIIINRTIYRNNNKKRVKSKFKPASPIKRKNILNTPGNYKKNKMSDIMLSKSKISSSKNSFIYQRVINSQKLNYSSNQNLNERKYIIGNNKRKINKKLNKRLYSVNNINSIYNVKSNNQSLQKNIYKNKLNENTKKLFLTIYDIQDMNYEEAVHYDKRGYLKIYWGFLVDTQIIFGTFCTKNYLNLFIIKLSFFVCTFQINFFLNAFFYTDGYISEAYHNNGVLDIISGLPKSIYSYIATLITTNLLRMLSTTKSELLKLIKAKYNNKNYLNLIYAKLVKLKIKLIVYFILVFLFTLFFLYYTTAFCAVYQNSQKYWFLGCLESFGIDSLVCIIICFLLALFRYVSIKKRIKCFYIFSNIISTFL